MLEISTYREEHENDWDAFVEQSNNGTLFHLQRFLAYHDDKHKKYNHGLIFRSNGKIVSVLPGGAELDVLPKFFKSPYGASYGGFVIPDKFNLHHAYALVECFIKYAKEQCIDNIQITMPPLFYYKKPHEYLDYALLKHGFKYEPTELTYIVPAIEDPFTLFNKKSRNATKKAVKSGIKTCESYALKTFYHILCENKRERHNAFPTHTLEELLWLREHLPNKLRLFMAFLKDEPIAGVLSFVTNKRVILTFYIAHRQKYQEYRPVNLLLHDVIKFAYIHGYKYVDLGTTARLTDGDNWNSYLLKESVSAVGCFRKRFVWEDENE